MQNICDSQQETQSAFASALQGWCNFSINLNKCCCIFRPCNYSASASLPDLVKEHWRKFQALDFFAYKSLKPKSSDVVINEMPHDHLI